MNKTISTKRLFSLAQYNNITFEETLADIPEKFAMDTEFMDLVRLSQLLEMEYAYRKYIKLVERIQSLPIDEALAEITTNKINTLDEIKNYLQGD